MTAQIKSPRPLVLMILDGFGYREETEHNAIALAKTPTLNALWQQNPHLLLEASGTAVGLPPDQMGNSEVGHLNIGSGRIIQQELTRINAAIATGTFQQNPVLLRTLQEGKKQQKNIHVLGLLSAGGVHSDEQHIFALCRLAAQLGITTLCLHVMLDGRDTPPKSAEASLRKLEDLLTELKVGKIASVAGRYYAMDRDKRYERTERYYHMLVCGQTDFHASSAITALKNAYARGETDEFVQPTLIAPGVIQTGDSVIFMNFRADRARQITEAFINPSYAGFKRQACPALAHFVSLTHYSDHLATEVAYPPEQHTEVLGACLAEHGLAQCRIAETEKYAHITFFFNGGDETPFVGEDRVLVPSPKIATYDLQPAMSAVLVTEKVIAALETQQYALIVVNFANADMVGHTGLLDATILAVETLDTCLHKILQTLDQVGGELILTADHGNAECMYDEQTRQPHTAHTTLPVPFIYRGRAAKLLTDHGSLRDIAPTILDLLDLPIPSSMTGQKLIALI